MRRGSRAAMPVRSRRWSVPVEKLPLEREERHVHPVRELLDLLRNGHRHPRLRHGQPRREARFLRGLWHVRARLPARGAEAREQAGPLPCRRADPGVRAGPVGRLIARTHDWLSLLDLRRPRRLAAGHLAIRLPRRYQSGHWIAILRDGFLFRSGSSLYDEEVAVGSRVSSRCVCEALGLSVSSAKNVVTNAETSQTLTRAVRSRRDSTIIGTNQVGRARRLRNRNVDHPDGDFQFAPSPPEGSRVPCRRPPRRVARPRTNPVGGGRS